jgi:hypothetical protein
MARLRAALFVSTVYGAAGSAVASTISVQSVEELSHQAPRRPPSGIRRRLAE